MVDQVKHPRSGGGARRRSGPRGRGCISCSLMSSRLRGSPCQRGELRAPTSGVGFFVWLEVLFMFGYRPELKARLDTAIQKDVKKFQEDAAAKKANGSTNGQTK